MTAFRERRVLQVPDAPAGAAAGPPRSPGLAVPLIARARCWGWR